MNQRVSAVIPAYNEEETIGTCIERMLEQTVPPDEVIVVDNNSQDRTAEIAQSHGVRVVPESRQGMIPARNTGFNSARYEVIARCDADTRVPADWVERIRKHFLDPDVDALCMPVGYYDLPHLFTSLNYWHLESMRFILRGKEVMIGGNMALRKKTWQSIREKVCMDETKIHEDIDLAMNIHRTGGHIKRDNTLIVQTSGRRIKASPWEFAVVYPMKTLRTLWMYR